MDLKQKSLGSKKSKETKQITSSVSHEQVPKIQTAEGWRRSVMRDAKKKS